MTRWRGVAAVRRPPWPGIVYPALLFLALFGVQSEASAQDFPHGTFPEGIGCMDCHTTEGWGPLRDELGFDHGELTGFPLAGRHAEASCISCHEDLHFENASASVEDCGTCHVDVHSGSLSANCSLCHTPTAFQDVSGIRIHQLTGFVLDGAHLQISCESCHTDDLGGAFSPLSTDCLACHQEEYEAAPGVDHVALGFPTDCLICHTPRSWLDIGTFDHAEFSGGFALAGRHQDLQCTSCHIPGGGLLFDVSAPEDCVGCHQGDYQREHAGSGYPSTCTLCHGQDTWDREDFDHAQVSGGYGLAGAHEDLSCISCHIPDGTAVLFSPADQNDCVACHLTDFQEEHAGSGYPTTCLDCHTVETWEGADSDHARLSSGFQLLGNHDQLACTSCHTADGSATLFNPSAPDDCLACHQTDYQAQHAGSGYPTTCLTCHQVTTWGGATVDHAVVSGGFALPTDHQTLVCTSCHTADGSGTLFDPSSPQDCVACHQADYQREHAGSGYSTDCTTCHSTSTWDGASTDHSTLSGGFGLLGNHDQLACTSCHTADGSATLFNPSAPDDCLACHQTDYQAQHAGSGYPTTCLTCHQVTTWLGAQFDHDSDFFPIYSGKHQGRWSSCGTCHTNPDDYAVFTCLNCHEHNKTDTDKDHSEVTGYMYESTQCLSCHPTGN